MLNKLIHACFPGCMVITLNQKELTPDLYNKEWPKFLREMISIEFKSTDNFERRIFNKEIENLQIVLVGNGISKKQNGIVTISTLSTYFLVPGEEEIFAIFQGAATGIGYARRESSSHEFEEITNVPENLKDLQKFIMKLLEESSVVIRN